jgi:hypothetical protein
MSDEQIIRSVNDEMQDILEMAAAQIVTLMNRHGETVQVGHFMAAFIWDLSEEDLAKIKEGGEEPNPHLKFVSNLEDDAQVEFLAKVAEVLAQDDVVRGDLPHRLT